MAATVIGTIGMVTATSAINSITTLSSNIFTLVSYLRLTNNVHHTDINKVLAKTDIEKTINSLKIIFSEIPEYYHSNISVVDALKNVQEIIGSIEDELKEIQKKTQYNSSLYFLSSWRSYDCRENLDSIDLKATILDKRRDNLFKILEVFKNCGTVKCQI